MRQNLDLKVIISPLWVGSATPTIGILETGRMGSSRFSPQWPRGLKLVVQVYRSQLQHFLRTLIYSNFHFLWTAMLRFKLWGLTTIDSQRSTGWTIPWWFLMKPIFETWCTTNRKLAGCYITMKMTKNQCCTCCIKLSFTCLPSYPFLHSGHCKSAQERHAR